LPHLFGVVLGVGITACVTALGVGAVVAAQPALNAVLRFGAAAFILWLAWGYWRAGARPRAQPVAGERPLSFLGAVLFQWINPKVWAIAFSASAAYGAGLSPLAEGLRLGFAFSSVNLGVCLFWASAGALLRTLLSNAAAWKVFMRVMALLLAASVLLIFR
jgi:threonine/homoserine/homoserine lactone efflux protein